MKKNNIIRRKNEKGAITLFVLLACLFFVFILSGVYISNLNKIQNQEREIKQIQENYARDLDRIQEVYESIAGTVRVTLSQNPAKETWTNGKITLTGSAIVEKEEQTIKYYVFSQNSNPTTISASEWKDAKNVIELEKTQEVEENGTYYFYVIDSEDNIKKAIIEVTNIDKNMPTAGTIGAKEYENGAEIGDYELGTSTDKDVYIFVSGVGNDEESEVTTTYEVKKLKDGSINTYTSEETVTLTETGAYEITIKTKDQAGNEVTNKYTVIIDKIVPILSLKHNDSTGIEYESGTWTKDDLYGEITIDTSATGKTLEKYQYSYNGVIWNDISGIPVQTSIDYTTTFPMGEDKPNWFSGPITPNSSNNSNGTYYFEVQEDGTLKPNNSGQHNKTANSYFEIDLTDFPEAELELTINATISSENNWDFGYAEITESTTPSTFNKNNTYYIKVSGSTTTKDYTTTLTGGKKYYLHIGYSKDSSQNKNQDTFIINSINLKSEALGKSINFTNYTRIDNKVTFTLNEEIEKEIYTRAIYAGENNIGKYGSSTAIKIDKTAPVIESATSILTSQTTAKANLTIKEDGSGLQSYYISTEETEPTESSEWVEEILNEFVIEGLNTGTTYYIWTKDIVGNISEKQTITTIAPNYAIDETKYVVTLAEAIIQSSDGSTIKLLNDYTDESTVTFDKNVTFDVQGYTLTRSKVIIIDSGKIVEITGTGKITTGTTPINTITNHGTLTISNNITIENMSTSTSYTPIYSTSITNVKDNAKIIGYYRGIYNSTGIININGGYIEAKYSSSSAYGIYNYYGSIYINAGEIKGYYGIYSYSSVEMTGGKIVGTGAYGIYAIGITNVYGGRIEAKTHGIYSVDQLTIGKQEVELSTTQPAIYGGSYGIAKGTETSSFNFYNGIIISNSIETAYRGIANVRENHMTYTYLDYEIEQKYCTILTPTVENITMEVTPTEYTNKDVTVKIIYPNTEGLIKEYSENGTDWVATKYNNEQIIISENKVVYARTLDESGILTEEKQIEINNIDKEMPTVTITPTETNYIVINENETKDISFTIKATDTGVSGLNIMQYAWAKEGENIEYIDFTNEVTINKTNLRIGTYNLYLNVTDNAGNKAELEQIRYNVKYQEPVAQIGETKYLTIQQAIEACSKEAVKTEQVEIDYTTTFPMEEDKPAVLGNLNNNGTYYFEMQEDGTLKPNNSGINSSTANSYFEIDLTNVGEEEEIQLTLNTTISSQSSYDYGYATITDNILAPSYNSTEGRFIYKSGKTTTEDHTTSLIGGKKYYLHIGYYKNSSSHSYDDTFIINSMNIKGILPQETIEEPTTIEILKSTDEEFNTYEGQNIILDLKGYTIGSSNIETPICTNNGTLTIIDSSIEKAGKLESLNATAIVNKSTGILTIGDSSTSIENEIPTIYGKKVGIKNEGIFNYYDGKIQGIAPIQGKVTNTPEEYGPVSTEYNNGITTVQLGIVSGYEARIEWVYYTTVQNAIDATKIYKNNTIDTVTITKDIQLKEIVEINNNQNIILDLNRYILTIVPEKDKVIENYGRLKITDSSVEQTGKIEITSNRDGTYHNQLTIIAIKNKGNLSILGGTIYGRESHNYTYSYAIYNYEDGDVTVSGGKVRATTYAIYNDSKSDITINGGMLLSGGTAIHNENIGNVILREGILGKEGDYLKYGINNQNSGTVIMKGGIINNISSIFDSVGICNKGTGNVVMENGTINVSSESFSTYGILNEGSGIVEIKDGLINGRRK